MFSRNFTHSDSNRDWSAILQLHVCKCLWLTNHRVNYCTNYDGTITVVRLYICTFIIHIINYHHNCLMSPIHHTIQSKLLGHTHWSWFLNGKPVGVKFTPGSWLQQYNLHTTHVYCTTFCSWPEHVAGFLCIQQYGNTQSPTVQLTQTHYTWKLTQLQRNLRWSLR